MCPAFLKGNREGFAVGIESALSQSGDLAATSLPLRFALPLGPRYTASAGHRGPAEARFQILVTVISTVDIAEALPEVQIVVSFAVNEMPLNAEYSVVCVQPDPDDALELSIVTS